MGNVLRNFSDWIFSRKHVRILMLGLEGAGKTTILYRMNLNAFINAVPTVGFNVEIIRYKSMNFTIWDIGGQSHIRHLWHYYFNNTDAIIFVVDSSDYSRLQEASNELQNLCNEEILINCVLLVFANKQDLPNAIEIEEISNVLRLNQYKYREWHIQKTSAIENKGLCEGFDWLIAKLRTKS